MSTADILALVAARRGLDLRDYRPETVSRGIDARLRATLTSGIEQYLARLRAGDDAEIDRLVEALLIPVTSFFRDPPVFDALRTVVLPELQARVGTRGLLRAWTAGVATGQEAWSLAMTLAEASELGAPFEVLASDIDVRSLETAQQACYPLEEAIAIPAALRHKYGVTEEQTWSPGALLRSRVMFAVHQLMGAELAPAAAVIASFQLVSVRNVLIYLERRLQAKLIERLASVVVPGGALVLGLVEVPTDVHGYFTSFPGVDPGLRIFRRREEVR